MKHFRFWNECLSDFMLNQFMWPNLVKHDADNSQVKRVFQLHELQTSMEDCKNEGYTVRITLRVLHKLWWNRRIFHPHAELDHHSSTHLGSGPGPLDKTSCWPAVHLPLAGPGSETFLYWSGKMRKSLKWWFSFNYYFDFSHSPSVSLQGLMFFE